MATWEWRKAEGGWTLPADHGPHGRAFHAHDVNNNAACDVRTGLYRSCEEPNEGSYLCSDCMEVLRANPAGRELREYQDS